MMEGLRYVYAVCRPFAGALPADLEGIGGAPVKQLEHDGLTAVLSPVPHEDFGQEPLRAHLEELDWLSATARAHERVIAALTTVTCPLPLRLATVFRDDSAVQSMLEDEAVRLHELLARIDGKVEWGVKVYAAESGAAREETDGTAADPARPAAASGRDYLRARRARRQEADRFSAYAEAFARELHTDLTARASAARLHPPQNPVLSRAEGTNVLNGAYLVRRSHAEEFVERVERAMEKEPGLRVELTGPWAAYSFSDPATDAAQEAP